MVSKEEKRTRQLLRLELALRMVQLGARTRTIKAWTGFTAARVRSMCKAYKHEFPQTALIRPPGPAPMRLAKALRISEMRMEMAALGGICLAHGVIPASPMADAHLHLPSLSRGQRICNALVAFKAVVREAGFTLELLLALLVRLAEGADLGIGRCGCGLAVLIDKRDLERSDCSYCRTAGAKVRKQLPAPAAPSCIDSETKTAKKQRGLFDSPPTS